MFTEKPMHVRIAVPDDAAAIASCLAELGYDTAEELVLERLRDLSTSANDKAFVSEDAHGRVMGVASAHRLPLFHVSGYLVRITALAVCKSAQGSGLGRMLVSAVESWAWSAGARRIEVTSGDHRPAAHAFYQAVGYVIDERRFVKSSPVQRDEGR